MFSRIVIKSSLFLRGPSRFFEGVVKWRSMQSVATAANSKQDDQLLKSAKPLDEMPHPPFWPIIGSAWLFLPIIGRYNVLKLHLANRQKHRLYGDVWREKFGPLSMVFSFRAEDMETICRNEGPYPSRGVFTCLKAYRESRQQWYKSTGLLILEGKEWQDLRRKTQKHLMKPKAIEAYVKPMQDVANDFVQRMCQIKDTNDEVPEFLEELYKWSLESVAFVGLDARLGTFKEGDSDGLRMIQSVQIQFALLIKLEGIAGNVQYWKIFKNFFKTPAWRRFEKASDQFSEIAFKYINQSLDKLKKLDKSSDEDPTLLQAMLASEELGLGGAMVTVADMLFAGIDTTAHTAGFLLYELAKHPDKQELLYQEVISVLSPTGGRLTSALLPELKYLRACLKESLRLHPIIAGVGRVLQQDAVIGGYRVPKKTLAGVSLQDCCLDERYFKNATQFLPERWLDRSKKSHPFAYLPFGFGPRSCIGRRLTELEITCLIPEVIKKFKVEYKYEDIDILTKFVATPDKPLKFTFIERN